MQVLLAAYKIKMSRKLNRRKVCVCIILLVVNLSCYLFYRELSRYKGVVTTQTKSAVIGGTPSKFVPPKDYEFVIAHYQEKLDWLRPVANHCHVYDKGHDSGMKPAFRVNHWEELPDVGRDAHTYLYHIIEYYENLANITIFLQGHLAEPFCFPTPMEFLEKARNGVLCVVQGKYGNWGNIEHIDKWLTAWQLGRMRHAEGTFEQFYRMAFEKAPPKSVDYCVRGCFSATRRCLQQHPKEFYERMIQTLFDHSDPEETHYLERLWLTIVSC